ncbi:MAG TPA: DNA recombination protein RmuC [Bacteroidetes bacterium]|nr:DNA recombination protein RmuC [Bacteroidota bacterium]
MDFILYTVLGLLVGGIITWVFSAKINSENRRKYELEKSSQFELITDLQKQTAIFKEKSESLFNQLTQKEQELSKLEVQHKELSENATISREQNKALQEKLTEHKKDLENIQEKFRDQFKVLADQIFEEKSSKFTKQNELNIKQILDPLGERLVEFKQKVEDTYNLEMKERITLQQQILHLTELNQGMREEANNLTKALKGDSKVQGNWGEIILERLLEKSGLLKGREYRVQVSGGNEEGRKIQPDVIIDLPDDRHLIIDSKVSITAFEKYSSAVSDIERDLALKEHIQSVRSHVKGLSEKNYQSMYEINSPDFVLMFIPIEPAFALTVQKDSDLYNEAIEKNIVIVSPTTLLATLSTIASIWKQEYRTRNAIEIASQGGMLYDKFVGFAEDLEMIGNRLNQTQVVYDQAMNKLKSGRGNLINRAEKLRLLGVKTTKKLSRDLSENDDLDLIEDGETDV